MVNIITGFTKKPQASESLKEIFLNNKDLEGYLYIGFPIIATSEGGYTIDALWISKNQGMVIFNLVENEDINNYEDIQDDCANKIELRLKGYKQLVDKRKLCVDINILTFAPKIKEIKKFNLDYPLVNSETLYENLKKFKWNENEYYEKLLSVLQSISTLKKGKNKRENIKEKSKGSKLKKLEESISYLDYFQNKAVIETVDGIQRIRGLAGSGKTIVIALKAAYLHIQHPEWKIVITFSTRSIKGQLKELITTFYTEQTGEVPNWNNIKIIHAWGAPGGVERNGIYYTFCIENNVEYSDYSSSKIKYGINDTFEECCKQALLDVKNNVKEMYDMILIDEAQDFSPSFLKLCYKMLKPPKRMVYAYDELQNLRLHLLSSPEEIFYENSNNKDKIIKSDKSYANQDIILGKCYRNSRPVLVTAHALAFGIYRNTEKEESLVQMFNEKLLWNDIGYEVIEGKLKEGSRVVLGRKNESSPKSLEEHSLIEDLIQFKSFKTKEEQNLWVSEQIKLNLIEDELTCDDIIVINPDSYTTNKVVASIRNKLSDMGIKSHIVGVDITPDRFFSNNEESIAFTGIHRVKGNEASMIYIINSESCNDSPFELAKKRNHLFTAITRSKAWVRVLGVGENMDKLIEEYNKIKSNNFTLDFTYPNKNQRERINIINRDMSELEKSKIQKAETDVLDLIKVLENKEIYAEDIGESKLDKLVELIKNKNT